MKICVSLNQYDLVVKTNSTDAIEYLAVHGENFLSTFSDNFEYLPFSKLKTLSLDGFWHQCYKIVTKIPKVFPELDGLELRLQGLTREDMEQIISTELQHLTKLDISQNKLDFDCLHALSQIDTLLMKCFSLENCEIGANEILALNGMSFPMLEQLNIKNNPLGPKGAKILSNLQLPMLLNLDLQSCKLGPGGAKCLTQGGWDQLQVLNLDDNSLGQKGLQYLTQTNNLIHLKELHLKRNSIGVQHIDVFKKLNCINLRHLYCDEFRLLTHKEQDQVYQAITAPKAARQITANHQNSLDDDEESISGTPQNYASQNEDKGSGWGLEYDEGPDSGSAQSVGSDFQTVSSEVGSTVGQEPTESQTTKNLIVDDNQSNQNNNKDLNLGNIKAERDRALQSLKRAEQEKQIALQQLQNQSATPLSFVVTAKEEIITNVMLKQPELGGNDGFIGCQTQTHAKEAAQAANDTLEQDDRNADYGVESNISDQDIYSNIETLTSGAWEYVSM